MADEEVVRSSGNVYADLGFEDPESMLVRARLAMEISDLIKAEGWSQREAAARMQTTQPKINDAVRGRIGSMSIDRLVDMLAAAGQQVEIRVHRAA